MFSDPIVAACDVDSGVAVTKSFTIINTQGKATDRINASAAIGEPKVLKMNHTSVGKGSSARKRHLVSLEAYGVVGGVEDPSLVGKVYLVADIPDTGFTDAAKKLLWQQFVGLVRGASGNVTYDSDVATFWTRFLNGES